MSPRAHTAALVCILVGLAASVAAAFVHYQLATTPGYESFCDVNATFSCAQAYQSAYGRLLGVPVSILGAGFFAGLLALATLGRRLEALASYLLVASLVGLGFVLYLAWATVFVLGTLCLLCLTTYAAVVGLFFIAGSAASVPMIDVPERLSRDLGRLVATPVALAACLLVIGATAASAAFFPKDPASTAAAVAAGAPGTAEERASAAAAAQAASEPPLTDDQKAQLRASFDQQPRMIVPADAEGAAVVVVKFNDYQCPPCRQTFELYEPIWAKFAGKVKFITRDFPLEGECNASAPNGAHQAACEAAAGVRMARSVGKASEFEHWLFANQPSLSPEMVKDGLKQVAGIADFDARYPTVIPAVKSDTALGASLGVQSTPTFFINGVRIPGGIAPRVLEYILEYEISKAAAPAVK
ncbi:vitamin K epoxide reductase family protein [Luteitalea sp. TBR-22]|uniref:vitamin K epoxide reductase family protein n=1 Tax=Luteitalea sp. TBR-22 TaxID=2802971 RepID=UPI001EF6F04A|nr:vitamin K epoxide reductase family protein [Luteitalea sp. TBR-22]